MDTGGHTGDASPEPLLPVAAVRGLVAAMAGASAGAIPQPGLGRPVRYGLGALVVGYWAAFARLARARQGA